MSADADFWYIPYNRGFVSVADGDHEQVFTSTYEELVMFGFDFQYIRPLVASAADSMSISQSDYGSRTFRFKLRVMVDGILQPGTGPHALAQDGKIRGTGFAGPSLRSHVMWIGHLQPGPHSIDVVAALGDDSPADAPYTMPTFGYKTDYSIYPSATDAPGAGIGNRKVFCTRFSFGTLLGA